MKLSVMARRCRFQHTAARRRLGTYSHGTHPHQEFQHTAARRRLAEKQEAYWRAFEFQHTAARRRLGSKFWCRNCPLCFNTQPPEGGWKGDFHSSQPSKVSTHSRPKAAGYQHKYIASPEAVSTHSRPKAAGTSRELKEPFIMFQHTAARRRLVELFCRNIELKRVSTHSRPKAAGGHRVNDSNILAGFNTQPPEGGWV